MGRNRLFDSQKKWCPGCKAWLPLDNFGNCKSQPSGKRSRCKLCFKEQNTPHVRKYQNGMSDTEIVVLWESSIGPVPSAMTPSPVWTGHPPILTETRRHGRSEDCFAPVVIGD